MRIYDHTDILTDLELLCFFFLSAPSPSSLDRLLRRLGTSELTPGAQSYLVSRQDAEQQLV